MSRCMPYPPPGYVRNVVPGEALIESIKEKPRTEKEKKREKKEKKKDRKRKEVEKSTKIEDAKFDKSKEDLYLVKLKGREDESEQVERSGLTEEHEQPISSQTLCYLSDSTQSSSKRKRDSSETSCSQIHGNVLRFRLPSLKIRESNEPVGKEQLCSTSGRINSAAKLKLPDQDQCFNNLKTDEDVKKVPPLSITCGLDKIPAIPGIKSHKDEKRWAELYSLIEDCVPLTLHNTAQDDQWLFETKHRDHGSKRFRSDNDAWLGAGFSLWPRAYHLPEAEIHALPYTVPF